MFGVDFPVGAGTVLFSARILFLGTGELLPEGVALFPGPSSQEDVEDPDSSSDDKVGGWSPVAVDWKKIRVVLFKFWLLFFNWGKVGQLCLHEI